MRNFNYIPVINDNGMVEFVNKDVVNATPGLIWICDESEIKCSPGYYYNQYKEKYA